MKKWLKYIAALLEELIITKKGSVSEETKTKKPGDPGGD